MNLFIDGEWNGFGGELISLALVSESGIEWYEVLSCHKPLPWIAENVIPKLNKEPVPRYQLVESLEEFLNQFERVHIIADWPEDLMHFCSLLITGPGDRIDTPPLTMEVLRVDAASENPHNALADARGLREHCLTL